MYSKIIKKTLSNKHKDLLEFDKDNSKMSLASTILSDEL